MEKLCSTEVINGDVRLKLPVGFRFRPTDEELIVHYLARKILSLPLPAPAVSELDVFRSEPLDLPGDLKERRHFFSRISRNLHGSDVSRRVVASGSGYWRPIGKEKQIIAAYSGSNHHHPIGVRKSFVFRQIRRGSDNIVKKEWILHELRLVGLRRPLCSTLPDNLTMPRSEELGEWAVYRVFQKKKKTKRHRCKEVICSSNIATVIDFGVEQDGSARSDPPPPSSPCSSFTVQHDSPFGVLLVDEDDEITSFH